MSLLSRLFGGGGNAKSEPEAVEYSGFSITPDPVKEGSQWRIAARIEKEIGGEVKSHQLIRADTLDSQDAAAEAALNKAKQFIDQIGDRVFD